jgi:hypothetical protein
MTVQQFNFPMGDVLVQETPLHNYGPSDQNIKGSPGQLFAMFKMQLMAI